MRGQLTKRNGDPVGLGAIITALGETVIIVGLPEPGDGRVSVRKPKGAKVYKIYPVILGLREGAQ